MSNNKSTPNPETVQLSLFDYKPDSDYPLPELIAMGRAGNEPFPLARHDKDGKRLYAVQDWIAGVARPTQVARYWVEMKTRASKAKVELFARCEQLPYKAANGRIYQFDHADAETLYIITVRMDSEAGIRNKVIEYLAKAGVRMDEYRLNPVEAIADGYEAAAAMGSDDVFSTIRAHEKITRRQLTDAIKSYVLGEFKYGVVTNEIYRGVTGYDTKGLQSLVGVSGKRTPLDKMSSLSVQYIGIANTACAISLANYGEDEAIPVNIARGLINEIARQVGSDAQHMADYLGVTLVTGQKQIGGAV